MVYHVFIQVLLESLLCVLGEFSWGIDVSLVLFYKGSVCV